MSCHAASQRDSLCARWTTADGCTEFVVARLRRQGSHATMAKLLQRLGCNLIDILAQAGAIAVGIDDALQLPLHLFLPLSAELPPLRECACHARCYLGIDLVHL